MKHEHTDPPEEIPLSVPSKADQVLIARYLDGALDEAAATACRRRLAQEPGLQAAADQLLHLRSLFARDAARTAHVTARPGFATSVVQAVRRLPVVDDEPTIRMARRLVVAAVLVAALSLLFLFGWLRPADPTRLEADPDAYRTLVEDLMRRIQERETSGAGHGNPVGPAETSPGPERR